MSLSLRVLLVEDSPTDAKLVIQALRRAGHAVEFERVETPAGLREALGRGGWDAVISDWSMPRFSGLGALGVVKEMKLNLPFIIVSGTVGEELAVEAMRAGAHDYVLKDKLTRLAPALEREIRECKTREERRRAVSDLEISEFRFSRLFESGIIATLIGDYSGNLFEANDTFLRLVGYSRAEFDAGKVRWRELTAPESQEATNRGIEELRAYGRATPYEKEYVRKDGTRVSVLAGFAALGDESSIGFMVDLTPQKRAEWALEKSEEQLRQAQKMEAVGRLAGGVAHDFNNLLSVILSYSAMILGDLPREDPMHEDIAQIAEAGRRAAGLTRQLLTFSRQEIVEPKVLDLGAVLGDMDKMLRRLLGEDVDFHVSSAASLGRVRMDRGHIEQVVMNLVVNARDAMPTGGKLTVETSNVVLDADYALAHHGVSPGPHVMLAVSDSGSGMDAETQARIFEPFFTTKGPGKGTGLGLSTVFGIVKQSRGTIWVYSEPRIGTTFKVYFPVVNVPLDTVHVTAAPITLRGSETILLVEDDDGVRTVAQGILKRLEYTVLAAKNGSEAITLARTHAGEIHLLLTDVVMPQMSGPELAKQVCEVRRKMKVLCMSGYTDDAIVRHGALEAGMSFVQKPFTPTTLARRVREVLDAG